LTFNVQNATTAQVSLHYYQKSCLLMSRSTQFEGFNVSLTKIQDNCATANIFTSQCPNKNHHMTRFVTQKAREVTFLGLQSCFTE